MDVALAAFGLTLLVQAALGAFTFGRLFERQRNDGARITRLEECEGADGKAASSLALSIARFEGDLRHLVDDVGEIKKSMNWMGRIANPEPHPKG